MFSDILHDFCDPIGELCLPARDYVTPCKSAKESLVSTGVVTKMVCARKVIVEECNDEVDDVALLL